MSTLEYRVASTLLRLLGAIFSLLPLRRRVVLASPRHAVLEGNLRFLRDALRQSHPDIPVVVLAERYGYGWREKVAYLLRAIRGMYYLRTSRVFVVDNAYLPVHVAPHRAGTTVIQVWHAVSAIKRFGLDTVTPPPEPERSFLHRGYDLVIVSAEGVRELYGRSLRTPPDRVLALGTPRTDFFFDPAALDAARGRVLAAHPELRGRRVVLFAPTLRGRGPTKHSSDALDGATLRARLPPEIALLIKGHPNVDPATTPSAGFDVVADPGEDMNELLAAADVLVTDYSSAVFEFALLRRPMILLIGDVDEYAREPGVAVDFERDMVGVLALDTTDVIEAILRDDFDLSGYPAFVARHAGACDGHASERLAALVAERLAGPLPAPRS